MASRNEVYEGNLIRVYHDVGRSEFTLLHMAKRNTNGLTYDALVIHPARGTEHTVAQPGSHLGRRVPINLLPEDIQKIIRVELGLAVIPGIPDSMIEKANRNPTEGVVQ